MVASIYGDDPDCKPDDRMLANARLIAAAPDLLLALVWLHSLSTVEGTKRADLGEQLQLAMASAAAAITKATGHQP